MSGRNVSTAVTYISLCMLAMALLPRGVCRGAESLSERVEAVVSKGKVARARVGVFVAATGSGRVIYARNAAESYILASNQKLITAAVTLKALGPSYRFTTTIYGTGTIEEGRLQGDLLVRGGGDPTLGGRYDDESAESILNGWAQALRKRGISRITGDVIADDGFFNAERRRPSWSDYPAWNWYYAPSAALSLNDSCVDVTVQPTTAGRPAAVSAAPKGAPVEFVNACKTHSRRQSVWFDRAEGSNVIKVGGLIRAGSDGYTHAVGIPDPPLLTVSALRAALEEAGVRVEGRVRVMDRDEYVYLTEEDVLLTRRTEIMPVLRQMVKRSHNHYAEQVIRTVGAEVSGVGSWQAGLTRAGGMLVAMGMDADEFALDDGSGLSRGNRMSPALLASMLVILDGSDVGPEFESLLAVSGKDGTLRGRLTQAPYGGNVRAKSGYLDGVGALSGYAVCRSGVRVAFSILVNDSENPAGSFSMRKLTDSICKAIVDCAE